MEKNSVKQPAEPKIEGFRSPFALKCCTEERVSEPLDNRNH